MGRVILCRGRYATTPYYIAQADKNIYSIEELCYYFYKNSYLLDQELMNEELVRFITEELSLPDLGKVLLNQLRNHSPLADFVAMILRESRFYPEAQMEQILNEIRENSKLDKNEKQKKRADYLAESGFYSAAIHEYENILKQSTQKDYVLSSAIYHNMGVCYANMFMFRCAADYFEKAYKINGKSSCLFQYMVAMKMSFPEEEYREKVLKDLATVTIEPEVASEMKRVEEKWQQSDLLVSLQQLIEEGKSGKSTEYYEKQEQLVNTFREEFRKSEDGLI